MKIKNRLFQLNLPARQSAFLWGPRKVGKSFWIRHSLQAAVVLDLLKSDVFAEYASRPALLRERFADHDPKVRIVIDEIQKIPMLLNEVHWLIENKKFSFLLTGSSARQLKKGHANLLGGRAWRRTMTPLSRMETEGFDLEKIMISGLLPPHFLSQQPVEDLRAYVSDYLKEEIASEALVRNIPAFTEFLRVAAITSSELLNYANLAREAGVSLRTVRAYFDILEDTYLGFRVPPWKRSKNRRMIMTEKFYFFDVGVCNYLARRTPRLGGADFGKSFEHYLLMELKAYQAYRQPDLPIAFWRTSTGQEVDFVLGDRETALEIKASVNVHARDAQALEVFSKDGAVKQALIVCLEKEPRRIGHHVQVLPWAMFLDRLWNGDYC